VAPGHEVLVKLVRHRIGDADDEGGGLAPQRASEQETEDRVLGCVRQLAEDEIPDAEAGAQPGNRRQREDDRRPGDHRQPERHDPRHGVPS
jgi:hypothetical protein